MMCWLRGRNWQGEGDVSLEVREFLLKGFDGARIEMNLVNIAHNLGKIWRMGREITA